MSTVTAPPAGLEALLSVSPDTDSGTSVVLFASADIRHHAAPCGEAIVAWLDDDHARRIGDNTAIVTIDNHQGPHTHVSGRAAQPVTAGLADLLSRSVRDRAWAPLFFVTSIGDGQWAAYSQVSVTAGNIVFVRLLGGTVAGNPRDAFTASAWLTNLACMHRVHGHQLGNHGQWFTNALPGWELEQKFTITSAADLWTMACELRDRVAGLAGWVLEPGNEFEQWDFDNHLFAVPGPPSQAGYIAMIPTVDKRWIMRRKWFTHDSPKRREHLSEPITLPDDVDLSAHLTNSVGVELVPLGKYRRIRYNVMAESLHTGHVFSIMVDHCIADSCIDDLVQVEVEYIRTRALPRVPPTLPDEEFAALVELTRDYLAEREVTAIEHDLSKLTWLTGTTPPPCNEVAAP